LKAAPNLNFTVIKPEQKSLSDFVQMLKTVYQNFIQVLNGNVGFGDGTIPDNISGSWINVVAPVAPNTDFTVNHNLQRLPVGYWIMQKDRACDVYTGSVAATTTQLTLRATVASAVLRLFIIGFLLSIFASRSEAQGAQHLNFAAVAVNTSAGSGVLKVIPSAVITVCNGVTLPPSGSICSGTALIFADNALTLSLSNPFNADVRGNYTFYAAAGQNYVVSVSGVGVTTYSYVWIAPFVGGSPNPAQSGTIRLANNDAINWRNAANTNDNSLRVTIATGNLPADALQYTAPAGVTPGVYMGARFISNSSTVALGGVLGLASIDSINWRNNANNADISFSKTANDLLVFSSGGPSLLLNSQVNSAAITGNGAPQTVYLYQIPANTVANLKGFRLTFGLNHSLGAGNVTYILSLLGVTIFNVTSAAGGSSAVQVTFMNTGATTGTATIFASGGGLAALQGSATYTTLSWASLQNLLLTFNAANTEQVTPIQWVVELIQ